jgi:hypothetical protein
VTEREVVGNREQAWVSIYMELHLLAWACLQNGNRYVFSVGFLFIYMWLNLLAREIWVLPILIFLTNYRATTEPCWIKVPIEFGSKWGCTGCFVFLMFFGYIFLLNSLVLLWKIYELVYIGWEESRRRQHGETRCASSRTSLREFPLPILCLNLISILKLWFG